MARGRMISSSLGRSKKFNALPDHFTKLVYILALTHADAEGRMEVDPHLMYADSFVFDSEASPERVRTALVVLADVKLIDLYESGDKVIAQFADFHEHNTIRRFKDGPKKGKPSKEAESKLPPPTGSRPEWARNPGGGTEQVRNDSGIPAPQENRREEKRREVLEPPKGSKTQPATTTEDGVPRGVGPSGAAPSEDERRAALQAELDRITATDHPEMLKSRLRRNARRRAGLPEPKVDYEAHLEACREARAEGREPPTPPGLRA